MRRGGVMGLSRCDYTEDRLGHYTLFGPDQKWDVYLQGDDAEIFRKQMEALNDVAETKGMGETIYPNILDTIILEYQPEGE